MKKLITFALAFTILLTGCSKGKVSDINAATATEKIEAKETMMLVLGSTTCGACLQYKDVTAELVKEYKINIYDVWVDKESTTQLDGKEVKADLLALYEKVGNITATPTIVFIKDGEVVTRAVGAISYSDSVKIAKESGIIE